MFLDDVLRELDGAELRVVRIRHLDWHVADVLDKFGIQGREREDFPGAAASLKGDIVQA